MYVEMCKDRSRKLRERHRSNLQAEFAPSCTATQFALLHTKSYRMTGLYVIRYIVTPVRRGVQIV